MTINFKNTINKINNARKEFVAGFKSGYNQATEKPQLKVVSVDGETLVEPTVSAKTGTKLGLVISMLAKFFRNRTVKMIMKCLGITAALTSAILNWVLIGSIANFVLFVLPLFILAGWGIGSLLDKSLSLNGTIVFGSIAFGSSLFISLVGIFNAIVWLFILGNPLMALGNLAMYVMPLMVWISTEK